MEYNEMVAEVQRVAIMYQESYKGVRQYDLLGLIEKLLSVYGKHGNMPVCLETNRNDVFESNQRFADILGAEWNKKMLVMDACDCMSGIDVTLN